MEKLSELIKSHGWKSNEQVAKAIEEVYPDIAAWVVNHPSANSIFGFIPGVSYYFDQNNVSVQDISEVIEVINKHKWYFKPILDTLKTIQPINVSVDKTIKYRELIDKIGEVFPNHKTRTMDFDYSLVSLSNLRQAIKATGYRYGAWVAEIQDCDEWAGRLWGALQRTNPGNLAIGFTTICGMSPEGKGQCHALLLAYVTEGLYWIENTGAVYKVGELPGWDNSTIELDVSLF